MELKMSKQWDILLGTVGTAGTITLSTINAWLALTAGILTVFVMALRARREWKGRDRPPED